MANLNIEEICYDLGSLSLHGLACGSDDDEIVLCLHGWLDNAASFLPLMPFFENKRVIAIDWAGHGFSSHRSGDAHYHFIDWVYDLLQLFELNQWQRINIVGHSMGGMIASAFSAAFPEKVKSLTLLDSIGFISAKAEQTTDQLRQGMLSRLKGRSKQKNCHPSQQSAINARVAVSDLAFEQAKIIVKRGLVKQADGYIWRADSRLRMTSPYRITYAQAKQFVKDIKVPVQLIYGEKGMEMVTVGLEKFGPLFNDFTAHQLPGGHHFHMEVPQATVQLVQAFIENLTAKN
ncbi:alpha/beta fold hydrolase [Thalassotalea sp. PLHSN55]|uniref:alpha/beta fold hydrolase n=1 Tax=Thalassotalea sp. PLHSN55 TaxID=3435888 RepID=UPI003F853E03